MKHFPKLALVAVAVSLAGCSVMDGEKIDYRSNTTKAPSLDVPPDLTQLSKDTRYTVVGGAVSASGFQATQPAAAKLPVAASSMGDVRVERQGNQRWLVVKRPADQLWEPVRDFWTEQGFTLKLDQSALGIMETDWAENRAKVPQDFIRSALGKIIDGMYSTPERDKFRTRLERSADGSSTEIYISHRGMYEIYVTETKDETRWQQRPVDPELEAEFLRRLMVRLGSTKEQAATLVASANAPAAAAAAKTGSSVTNVNGQAAVLIDEGFDRAWRRVGLALDRTGFTVEDRDRKQGIYFVRYVGEKGEEPGFFAKLFSGEKAVEAQKYQITVKSQGEQTTVAVLNGKGVPDNSEHAQRIIKVIADDIK